jgi:hypothetical protein
MLTCCRKLELSTNIASVVTPNRPAVIVLTTSGTDPTEAAVPTVPQLSPRARICLVLAEYARDRDAGTLAVPDTGLCTAARHLKDIHSDQCR